jgi:glycosyltransferase involved in cell wall biosynthesis
MTDKSNLGSKKDWPFVSIVIINSRGGEMFEEAFESCKKLFYPNYEILVEDNLQKSRTIGKCWNSAIKDSKGDWILFIGDDDRVSQDYLVSLMLYYLSYYSYYKDDSVVCVTSYVTMWNDEMTTGVQTHPTGMWRKDYLLSNPFDESLKRHVDSEYFERMNANGKRMLTCFHQFGYFYRQHSGKVSGEVKVEEQDGEIKTGRDSNNSIYAVARYLTFFKKLEEELSGHYDVILATKFSPKSALRSKLIWIDWADESAIECSNIKTKIPRVLRIRSFEAFTPWILQINFDAFDYVLFVAEHIKDYVEKVTGYKFGKRGRVIPNGIKLEKFRLNTEQTNKVAWVGYLANKKGVNLLLLVAKTFPELEFHVAGNFQEKDVEWYFNEQKTDNVFFHGWQNDMNEFFQDKSYILNTSPREGNPNAVMEGMACGCKPLVYGWNGADNIYGEFVWRDMTELESLIESPYEPERYRKFIEKNYDFRKSFEKYKFIVDNLWNKKQ